MYYLYILYAATADKYYVGYTDNVQRRLSEHNTSERNTYTSKFRPWEIKAIYQIGSGLSDAVRIERYIKRQKSRALLEHLVTGGELHGVLTQLVRVPHVRD